MLELLYPLILGLYLSNQPIIGTNDIIMNQYNVGFITAQYVYPDYNGTLNKYYQKSFVTHKSYIRNKKFEYFQIVQFEFTYSTLNEKPTFDSYLWIMGGKNKTSEMKFKIPLSSYYLADYNSKFNRRVGLGVYYNWLNSKPINWGDNQSLNINLFGSFIPFGLSIIDHKLNYSIDCIIIPDVWYSNDYFQVGINATAIYSRPFNSSESYFKMAPSIYAGISW